MLKFYHINVYLFILTSKHRKRPLFLHPKWLFWTGIYNLCCENDLFVLISPTGLKLQGLPHQTSTKSRWMLFKQGSWPPLFTFYVNVTCKGWCTYDAWESKPNCWFEGIFSDAFLGRGRRVQRTRGKGFFSGHFVSFP